MRDVNNWPVAPNTTVTFSMGTAPASTQPLIYHWFTIDVKAESPGSAARFKLPACLSLDSVGNVYVADWMNHTIRMGVPLPVFQNVTKIPRTRGRFSTRLSGGFVSQQGAGSGGLG